MQTAGDGHTHRWTCVLGGEVTGSPDLFILKSICQNITTAKIWLTVLGNGSWEQMVVI